MTARTYLSQSLRLNQRINSKLEQIQSLRELATKCTPFLTGMPKSPNQGSSVMADAVIKIASYGVPQIVYVSCNPKTLALNLSQFSKLGYRTEYLRPYDNFPFTKHVECCSLLVKTSDSEV